MGSRRISLRDGLFIVVGFLAVVGLGLVPLGSSESNAAETEGEAAAAQAAMVDSYETTEGVVYPEFGPFPAAQPMSESDRAEMLRKFEELKEGVMREFPTSVEGPPSRVPETLGPETRAVAGGFAEGATEAPGSMKLFAVRNARANNKSDLAEPVAAATGRRVFAMGNTHAEWSDSKGIGGWGAWHNVAIPAGPASAPNICCDPDVQFIQSRGATVYVWLYLNSAVTSGAVRIHVRRNMEQGNQCTYTFPFNGIPDYPHIGISNDFIYLAVNHVGGGAPWFSQIRRYNMDQMVNCQTTSFNTWTYNVAGGAPGQRVFVPAEGATDTMYWVSNENTTQSRVFQWAESSTTVTSNLVNRSASVFANPDCRGGLNNWDWIERTTAWSIAGFRMRSVVRHNDELIAYWNSAPVGGITQAHIRAAQFNVSTSTASLLSQPHIFWQAGCYGFPAASTNARGDIGLSVGYGGKAGGGGSAARGYVAIIDDFTGLTPEQVYLTANGDRNRSDGRHGDYYSVRQYSPCGLGWVATNYGLYGLRNVRITYFSRERDWRCLQEWFNREPA